MSGGPSRCSSTSRKPTSLATCPYGKGGSTSFFDGQSKDVTLVGYWLSFPQHTTFLVVETDDIVHLHAFLQPGAGVTTCEITPVMDEPMPVPGRGSA